MKIDLRKLNLSDECAEYFDSYPDFETAWNECDRADWMVEIAERLNVYDTLTMLTAAHCVNTIRHLIPFKESKNVIDSTIAYCHGDTSMSKLDIAVQQVNHQQRVLTRNIPHYVHHEVLATLASCDYMNSISIIRALQAAEAYDSYVDYFIPHSKSIRLSALFRFKQETSDISRKLLSKNVLKNLEKVLRIKEIVLPL